LPRLKHPNCRYSLSCLLAISLWVAGCVRHEPIVVEDVQYFEGDMPADFSGSWARDYSRGDDINQVLRDAYYELSRRRSQAAMRPGPVVMGPSESEMSALMPLARLAELITRPDELTISQTEHEILVERQDDFALLCSFYDGIAKPTDSAFGKETCGWTGNDLVSLLELSDGLKVVHRFTISEDRKGLRVITTVSSDTARLPFTLSRFYWRFEKIRPTFECIETLSMKRVCSTGKLTL
jgi:hypothetical protein